MTVNVSIRSLKTKRLNTVKAIEETKVSISYLDKQVLDFTANLANFKDKPVVSLVEYANVRLGISKSQSQLVEAKKLCINLEKELEILDKNIKFFEQMAKQKNSVAKVIRYDFRQNTNRPNN
jgi:hypothetical protein